MCREGTELTRRQTCGQVLQPDALTSWDERNGHGSFHTYWTNLPDSGVVPLTGFCNTFCHFLWGCNRYSSLMVVNSLRRWDIAWGFCPLAACTGSQWGNQSRGSHLLQKEFIHDHKEPHMLSSTPVKLGCSEIDSNCHCSGTAFSWHPAKGPWRLENRKIQPEWPLGLYYTIVFSLNLKSAQNTYTEYHWCQQRPKDLWITTNPACSL